MNLLKHILFIIAGVVILLVIPFWCCGGLQPLFSSEPDAQSSATMVLEKPSGRYYILINKDLRKDEETLRDWVTFFGGGEILYIFEDIGCSVADGDEAGLRLAQSFRSILPENQMQITSDDPFLLASRVDHGLYDVAVISKEYADMTGILAKIPQSMEVVLFEQDKEEQAE